MSLRGGNKKQKSFLKANHKDKEYNQTLSHVYETAIASLDKKSSSSPKKKGRVPNIFSLCFKSAADEVLAGNREDDVFQQRATNTNTNASHSTSTDPDAAGGVDIMLGPGGPEQSSLYATANRSSSTTECEAVFLTQETGVTSGHHRSSHNSSSIRGTIKGKIIGLPNSFSKRIRQSHRSGVESIYQ